MRPNFNPNGDMRPLGLKFSSESKPVPIDEAEIRRRISAGTHRRRKAKLGTWKRLTGNCVKLAAAACFITAAAVGHTCTFFSQSVFGDRQVDVVEIFAGNAEVSLQFARRGGNVAQPVDLIYGSDLRDENVREQVKGFVRENKPRLVIVSYPCKYWTSLVNTNFRTSQERRRLKKLQQGELPFLQLCEDIFDIQIQNGNDALAENPIASASFRQPPIKRILSHPQTYIGVSHGCQFGFKHPKSGLPLKKPTMWIATSPEICDELSRRCPNSAHKKYHDHGECQGGNVTQHASHYTKELAHAIHKGFVRTIARKEPHRLRRLLMSVKKRLGKPGEAKELKWTQQSISKALERVNSVLVQDGNVEESAETPHQVIEPGGVSFEVPAGQKLDATTKSVLRKIHCNLGHPSTSDLQRFLRGAGAHEDLIRAAEWLVCSSCAKTQRARTHRTVRIPPHDLQFNDQIMIDCFHIKDSRKHGHWFMSVLDRATMYHQVIQIRDHSPDTFIESFFNHWTKWAGYPLEVSIDLERGFGSKAFADALGHAGISVVPIASQAHWQHGKIERHGGVLKEMLQRVFESMGRVRDEHVRWLADEVTMAKNMLVREHGFSPSQLLFGKEPRCFGEIEANGEPCSYHQAVGDKDTQIAVRMKMRVEARKAYFTAQSSHMLSQTARNRTRPWKEPQIGDRCFFFHEFRKKGVKGVTKAWHGPALVVGLQGQSNIWVVYGGKCYLVAQEHCREAVGEELLYGRPEVQEALTLFKDGDRGSYRDLTDQKMNEDDLDHVIDDVMYDSDEEMIPDESFRVNTSRVRELPDHLLSLCREAGWTHDSLGNPVQIAYKAYALRIPGTRIDGAKFVFRTSWALMGTKWRLLEDQVKWSALEDPHEIIPGGPADILISVFTSKTRKEMCLEDLPVAQINKGPVPPPPGGPAKRQKVEADVFLSLSRRKAQRALDKEVPRNKIPQDQLADYKAAEAKEWNSWIQYDAVEPLSPEESKEILEKHRERVLKSRFVYRNKNAGLVGENGEPLSLKAKARLCVQGQNDPDCLSGEVQLDAPTIQHASFLTFLHCVISFGWLENWRSGDISSAFLQGEETVGNPLYMFLPESGLPNLGKDQILRLKRPVYGRPDAPRAWYNQISSFIMSDMGFERSILDPALFIHRDHNLNPNALLVLHVDDLMIATDGSLEGEKTVDMLYKRFPFGEWCKVHETPGEGHVLWKRSDC